MERSVDELAELARDGLAPGQFFAEVLRRALVPGGARQASLWRAAGDRWEFAGGLPAPSSTPATPEDLGALTGGGSPRIQPDGARGECRVLCPVQHATTTVGVLETAHVGTAPDENALHFLVALAEIAGDYLSQLELAQLRSARATWGQWDQFQLRLGQTLELDAVADVIANDGRILVGCDRVTVLRRRRAGFQVVATSGAERIDRRAGSIQLIERFAWAAMRQSADPLWLQFGDPVTAPSLPQSPAERYWRESGTRCVGLVPVPAAGSPGARPGDGVLIFETFPECEDWDLLRERAEQLALRSASGLGIALERQGIPWLKTWLRWRGLRHRLPQVVGAIAVIAAFLAALILIPAELTVTGTAELWPSVRRDVFASGPGIVDEIRVEHGDGVQAGQALIQLRDPDLEQELPRIAGEIATTQERLRGVQIARLTGAQVTETPTTGRQLTAEEEELKERLRTLQRQHQLLKTRQERLTLRSPIAGQVLTWDLQQHLQARPVERGQALLTVGATDGDWVLEVRVSDQDAGHLLRAQAASGEPLPVRFQLPAEPGRTCVGTVQRMALATESSPDSTGYLRVIVAFDRQQVSQLRPGAQAIPRISCGRSSIGYVWLHDLIDTLRTRWFL